MDDTELEKLIIFEFRLKDRFKEAFHKWDEDTTKNHIITSDIPMLKVMENELSPGAAQLVRYFIDRKNHSCWLLLQSAFDLIESRNIGSTQVAMFPIIRAAVEQLAKVNWIFGESLSVKNEEGISKFSASGVREKGAIRSMFERTAKLELCEILHGLKEEELFIDNPAIKSRKPNMIDVKLHTAMNAISENYSSINISDHSSNYKEMYSYARSKQVFGFGEPDRTTLAANFVSKYFSMSNIQSVEEKKPYALVSFLSHSPDYTIMQFSKLQERGGQQVLAVTLTPHILDMLIVAQTFLVNIVCWNYLVYGFSDEYFANEVLKLNNLRNEFLDAFEITN